MRAEVGQIRKSIFSMKREFNRNNIDGVIDTYYTLRRERKHYIEQALSTSEPPLFINVSIRFNPTLLGCRSFLFPNINFSQTFDFFENIRPEPKKACSNCGGGFIDQWWMP